MMYVFCLAVVAEVKRYKGAKDVGENIVSDDHLWNSEQEDGSGNTYSLCQCYLAFTNTSLSLWNTYTHTMLGQEGFKGDRFLRQIRKDRTDKISYFFQRLFTTGSFRSFIIYLLYKSEVKMFKVLYPSLSWISAKAVTICKW